MLSLVRPQIPQPSHSPHPFKAKYPTEVTWLEEYKGKTAFLHSLKAYYNRHGRLSEKQLSCVRKAMTEPQGEE